jgi:hypothetical protein
MAAREKVLMAFYDGRVKRWCIERLCGQKDSYEHLK